VGSGKEHTAMGRSQIHHLWALPFSPAAPVKPRIKPRSNELVKTKKDVIVKSDPCTLEAFDKKFMLPQTVRVYAGHYGVTEQLSISEGEELILFFVKSSRVVKATTRNKSETYYLPLNSLLQFSPYYQTALDSNDETACHQYPTVRDLIQRTEGLPKVVKVLKSCSGASHESSVVEGDIIFPKEVSGKGRNAVLKCINKNGKKLKLGINCAGKFSTDPCDVKMYLLEYIEYINEFPAPLIIFSEKEQSKKILHVYTSTVLVLDAPQPLRSYICSTDIFGKSDYPMIELPMIMPIQVQRIERPGLKMEPIYSKVQHAYENFNPSLIKTNMYPAQNQKAVRVQQQFYEEVKKDDKSANYYELECPEAIYEPIPGEIDVARPPVQYSPQQGGQNTDSEYVVPVVPKRHPLLSPSPLATDHNKVRSSATVPVTSPNLPTKPVSSPTPEENIAYLKKMDLDSILQLLVDMNLAEYKDTFKCEQVDGELLVDLTVEDLAELGVTKRVHQKRLMKLIDGSSSAKKYEGGVYSTLS